MTAPEFSIAIVTHGRPDLLSRTLSSLVMCKIPDGFQGVLVIENGRQCGAEDAVRMAAPALKARYHFVESPSKSVSLNEAVRALRDQWILFLDDDVRVPENLLTSYATAFLNAPAKAYFGGPTSTDAEATPPAWLVRYLPASAIGKANPPRSQDPISETTPLPFNAIPQKHFLGFNWSARAVDLVQCGGFDARLGPGTRMLIGEEGFMQLRLSQHGFRGLCLPEAMVWHYVPQSRLTPEFAMRRAYPGGFMRAVHRGLEAQATNRPVVTRWQNLRRHLRRYAWPTLTRAPYAFPFVMKFLWRDDQGYRDGAIALKEGQWMLDSMPLEMSSELVSTP